MYKNREIIFKGKTVHTIRDFIDILSDMRTVPASLPPCKSSDCLSDKKFVLESMLRYETAILQVKLKSTSCKDIAYSFKSMVDAQNYLEALDCIESIKYAPYTVNARQLLYKSLYSLYNISSFNPFTQTAGKERSLSLDTEIIRNMKILDIEVDIDVNSGIDINNPHSPSKTIRNLFSDFLLEMINISETPYLQCNLYPSMTKFNFNKSNYQVPDTAIKDGQRLYLPIYDIPAFFLLFSYYDHRNFENISSQSNRGRVPKKKLQNAAIYRLIIQKAKEHKLFGSPPDSCFLKSCQWRCDNIFLFYKMNTLFKYYNLYTSDAILNDIIQSYKLSYTEILELKDFIVKEIFHDRDFILRGLTSKYLDFMLPFDIFFRYDIYARHLGKSYDTFKENLKSMKGKTKRIYDIDLPGKSTPPITIPKDGLFHISKGEEELCQKLNENDFYKKYYNSNSALFFEEAVSENNIDNISDFGFTVIQEALKETTGINIKWQ